MRAAIDGSMEILPAVFASVLTTVMVFSIFFFIEGRIGEFMQSMATVVMATLLFSLIEAALVLPAHLASRKILMPIRSNNPILQKLISAYYWLKSIPERAIKFTRHKIYGRVLAWIILNKYVALAGVFAFIMMVLGAMQGGVIGRTFFPPIARDEVQLGLVMPPGTREHITEKQLRTIVDKALEVNQWFEEKNGIKNIIQNVTIEVGNGGGESGGHTGNIELELLGGEERGDIQYFTVEQAIRKKVGEVKDAEKFTIGSRGFFGKPVSLSIRSGDLSALDGFKEDLKAELRKFSELKDVTDNDVVGKREVQIELKDKAYSLGLTHGDISRQIRQGFFGQEVQRLQKGPDEVKVWVRYPETDRSNLGKLEEVKIKTMSGAEYPLTELVDYQIGRSSVTINHIDGMRELRVEADLVNKNDDAISIEENLRTDILPKLYAKYPGVRTGFEGQSRESNRFGGSTAAALPVVLAAMIILIALVFRSFSQAFLVFLMIPLAVFCAFLGHGIESVIQGKPVPVSILSLYGIFALIGIIVNDAVIFLDKFNRLLKSGLNIQSAAYEAGLARFRAIVLTSITTVAGLYPIIFEKSFQAQFLKPMAISVAYGVLFGTFFILLFFPALILIYNDIRRFLGSIKRGYLPTSESVEPAVEEQKRLQEI